MGCCLSRPEDKRKNSDFKNYNSTNLRQTKEDFMDILDTKTLSDLLVNNNVNSEKADDIILLEPEQFVEEEDLPTFNYPGMILKEPNRYELDNYDNPIFNVSYNNKTFNYSIDGEEMPMGKQMTKTIEQNINLNNINNAPYFSINSNSIVGNSNYFSNIDQNDISDLFIHKRRNVSNVFSKKNFIFLYFEFNHFIFWARDYLISLYPEVNLVMVLEINDSKLTQEKIYFTRSKDDINKYIPMKKKIDVKANHYRILQAFEIDENDMDFPFKISINFYTYTNHKMISICYDEIFVKITKEGELQKYKMYQNIYMKHYNKKVGNLIFNFAYKSNEIYPMDLEDEKAKYLIKFNNLENFAKFDENQELTFIYYGVENFVIKENGNFEYSKYFSIKEIDDSEELKGEVKLNRLLELMTTVKKKFEFYQIIKKVNNYFATKELIEEKLIDFKENLLKRLEEFAEKTELTDKILIPFIFTVLKKACFKIKSNNGGNSLKSRSSSQSKLRDSNCNQSNSSSNRDSKSHFKEDFEKIQIKNTELLIKFFNITFSFLRVDILEDISLSALNFIFKYLEESLVIFVDGKTTTSDDYFFEYIVEKKYYTKFCDMILKYFEYQACVLPTFSILAKIIRLKKTNCLELIEFFNSEKFSEVLKKIIRIHDCNSATMSNIFSTLFNLIDYIDINNLVYIVSIQRLKEVFNIFRMTGFDFIHETIINLVKGILIRRCEKPLKRNNSKSISQFNTNANTNSTSILDADSNSNCRSISSITLYSTNVKINNDTSSLININSTTMLNTNISDEEYTDVIIIFSNALIFIKNKILMLDFFKLSKWVYSVLTHLYTIAHIINSTNQKNLPKMINVIADKKISEYLIECLCSLADKKIFAGIDTAFEILDLNLIKIKIMIFRTIFHILSLIKTLKDLSENTLVRI